VVESGVAAGRAATSTAPRESASRVASPDAAGRQDSEAPDNPKEAAKSGASTGKDCEE
jgi:hypothetical protein